MPAGISVVSWIAVSSIPSLRIAGVSLPLAIKLRARL
jgi:hypothetical protein